MDAVATFVTFASEEVPFICYVLLLWWNRNATIVGATIEWAYLYLKNQIPWVASFNHLLCQEPELYCLDRIPIQTVSSASRRLMSWTVELSKSSAYTFPSRANEPTDGRQPYSLALTKKESSDAQTIFILSLCLLQKILVLNVAL